MNILASTKRLKLDISFKGTSFYGWQTQPDRPTVQSALQNALCKIVSDDKINIIGSSRTDTGVHALSFIAHADISSLIPIENIRKGLNSILSDDIVVRSISEVDRSWHARFNAKAKHYRYLILNSKDKDPFRKDFVWRYHRSLDTNLMKEAAKELIGRHDFASFQGSGSSVSDTVRELFFIDISKEDEIITIDVTGDGFLRHMVRNIVGLLSDIGRSKLSKENIKKMLMAKNRQALTISAPACGLYLVKVYYENDWKIIR